MDKIVLEDFAFLYNLFLSRFHYISHTYNEKQTKKGVKFLFNIMHFMNGYPRMYSNITEHTSPKANFKKSIYSIQFNNKKNSNLH